jgi:hypothetical protein
LVKDEFDASPGCGILAHAAPTDVACPPRSRADGGPHWKPRLASGA